MNWENKLGRMFCILFNKGVLCFRILYRKWIVSVIYGVTPAPVDTVFSPDDITYSKTGILLSPAMIIQESRADVFVQALSCISPSAYFIKKSAGFVVKNSAGCLKVESRKGGAQKGSSCITIFQWI